MIKEKLKIKVLNQFKSLSDINVNGFFFQNAVMTFEEEKMSLALSTLRTAEKRCTSDISWSPSFNNLQQTVKSRLWRLPSREVAIFQIWGTKIAKKKFFVSVGLTEYQACV